MTASYIDPSRENFERFKALARDRPIHMLNLIKFREWADYPEDHDHHGKGLSGREAYTLYRDAFQAVVAGSGAAMVWEAPMECVVTGPEDEWDEAFVMGYPDAQSFFAMVKDEAYARDILLHRTAAVAESRLLRFRG